MNAFVPRSRRWYRRSAYSTAKLRHAFELLKRASVFKKALAAEAALPVAVDLFEEILEEIERLKGAQTSADRRTQKPRFSPQEGGLSRHLFPHRQT